jgi:hypothetical protein
LTLASSQFDVVEVVAAVLAQNREVANPVEGMVRIPNGDLARVAGIIPCRL